MARTPFELGSPEEYLLRGLIGKHTDQYRNDSYFSHALDLLASWLPAMVDGLALRSWQRAEDERKRLLHEQLILPPIEVSLGGGTSSRRSPREDRKIFQGARQGSFWGVV